MSSVDLVLQVVYNRRRADEYLAMDKKDTGRMIRRDFDDLKLPHPPEENIRRPSHEGITVSWLTRVGTPLYNTVTRVLDRQDVHPTSTAKARRGIKGLYLKELSGPRSRNRRDSTSPRRRLSSSPPMSPIVTRVETVDRIDNVMRSLHKISKSISQEAEAGKVDEAPVQRPRPTAPAAMRHPIPTKPGYADRTRDRLEDELRVVRKQVAEDMDKAARLEREIEALRSPGEIDDDQPDLDRLTRASLELSLERKKREEVEHILADVQRECFQPTVVPELLKMIGNLNLGRAAVAAPGSG